MRVRVRVRMRVRENIYIFESVCKSEEGRFVCERLRE